MVGKPVAYLVLNGTPQFKYSENEFILNDLGNHKGFLYI